MPSAFSASVGATKAADVLHLQGPVLAPERGKLPLVLGLDALLHRCELLDLNAFHRYAQIQCSSLKSYFFGSEDEDFKQKNRNVANDGSKVEKVGTEIQ